MLRRDLSGLSVGPGPLRNSVFEPLVEQQESVTLPVHPVPSSTAEQIQSDLEWVKLISLNDDGRKAINGLSHIRLAACDEDTDIILKPHLHDDRPMRSSTDSRVAGSAQLWISTSLP